MDSNINNVVISASSHSWDEADSPAIAQTIKVVQFNIGNINFAIRVESVYKVLSGTNIFATEGNWVGVAHISDREVTVLDLQKRFFQPYAEKGYIVIVQHTDGELYGLFVPTVPAIIDLPIASVRILPASFRQADALGIASHVAIREEGENTQTIFLLDLATTIKLTKH
jgi:chemotaxis signal transduction protein